MTIAIWALATYSIVATATHLGSILIATSKCRKPRSLSRPAESQTALGLLGLTRYLRRTGRRATRARDCTHAPSDAAGVSPRSEERRVGKECRSRWSPHR